MGTKEVIKRARGFAKPFRVTDGSGFRLKDIDPGDTLGLGSEDKPRAKDALAMGVEALAELQDRLYAQDRWAVLLIFQAMDAAGKDGTIKHVMSGVNPQGCRVYSFKAPSSEDLDHDFLWRCMKYVPERRRIGIFNRSYYEETLVVRIHPEFLEKQTLAFRAGTDWDDLVGTVPAQNYRPSRRKFVVSRQVIGNLEPTGFAADKDVALGAHSGIIVQRPERDAKFTESLRMAGDQPEIRLRSIQNRRAAYATKPPAIAWRRLVVRNQRFALNPLEVGSTDARPAAKCGPLLFATQRAMAVQRAQKWSGDFEFDTAT
jgi:hypothetical protein